LTPLPDHPLDPLRRVERDVVARGGVVVVLLALAVLLGDAGEPIVVMGWRSSTMRPSESARSTAPDSSTK